MENETTTAAFAAHIYAVRRLWDGFFEPRLFADPARDILLDLYSAHCRGRPISVGSACIAAAVPPTTALRYIDKLQEIGLLYRYTRCGDDRRFIYVGLTEEAIAVLTSALRAMMGPPVWA